MSLDSLKSAVHIYLRESAKDTLLQIGARFGSSFRVVGDAHEKGFRKH